MDDRDDRDDRDRPNRQHFYRGDRELLQAIKWKPLLDDRDDWDDRNDPKLSRMQHVLRRPLNSTLAFSMKKCKSTKVSTTNSHENTKTSS